MASKKTPGPRWLSAAPFIEPPPPQLSVHRQCQLLGLPRSSFYYQPVAPDRLTLELMNAIDRIYTEHPIYGVRRIGATLRRAGYPVNPKRVHRLMKAMGLQAIYPRTRRTPPRPGASGVSVSAARGDRGPAGPRVVQRHRAPRGAVAPCGGERPPPSVRLSGLM